MLILTQWVLLVRLATPSPTPTPTPGLSVRLAPTDCVGWESLGVIVLVVLVALMLMVVNLAPAPRSHRRC